MCVVFDWSRTTGDASVPCSAQPDAHQIWHCRVNGVTGMWQGSAGPKWLLRLHYPAKTPDTPSPISHFPFMVTDPRTIHKSSTDYTLPFSQHSLITHRWKLASPKIIYPLCCKSKKEVEQGAECQEPGSSSGNYPAGSVRCWYLHCHSWWPLESESICQEVLWEAMCWRWPEMNVSLAETQISTGGVERVKTAAALGQDIEKWCRCETDKCSRKLKLRDNFLTRNFSWR